MFKSKCTPIKERLYKLEGHLKSRNIQSKTFAPLQSFFKPPLQKITLKKSHNIFSMKDKDICDNDPRCIVSSGLMVDDIIMDHMKRTQSSHKYTEEHDYVFTHMYTDVIYIYRGSLTDLHWKKGT